MAREIIPYDKNIKSNIFEIDTILSAKIVVKMILIYNLITFVRVVKLSFLLPTTDVPLVTLLINLS